MEVKLSQASEALKKEFHSFISGAMEDSILSMARINDNLSTLQDNEQIGQILDFGPVSLLNESEVIKEEFKQTQEEQGQPGQSQTVSENSNMPQQADQAQDKLDFQELVDNTSQVYLQLDLSSSETLSPKHSLELNLILVFIFASSPVPVSEGELLRATQANLFGYLTRFKDYSFLKKSWHLLRPINIPFKTKWIHDTMQSLPSLIPTDPKHLQSQLFYVQWRIFSDLLPSVSKDDFLQRQVGKLLSEFQSHFNCSPQNLYLQVCSLVCIGLKLVYGLKDGDCSVFGIGVKERKRVVERVREFAMKVGDEDGDRLRRLAGFVEE